MTDSTGWPRAPQMLQAIFPSIKLQSWSSNAVCVLVGDALKTPKILFIDVLIVLEISVCIHQILAHL